MLSSRNKTDSAEVIYSSVAGQNINCPFFFLQDLMSDMDVGHNLLKSAREKGEKAIKYMEANEGEQLKKEINGCVEQLDEMTSSIRKEHTTLEKCLHLTKEFLDKYKVQTQWLSEYQIVLHTTVDPKMELYEKKAQLSKYKVNKYCEL